MQASEAQLLYTAAAGIDRLARAHRAAAADALRDLGVSEATAGLLWLLDDNAGCTMGDAAALLSCDRSNVTLLATQLEKRGFVERTSDPDDARRRTLRLTPAGEAAATRLRDAITTGSPLATLDEPDRALLVSLLRASLGAGSPGSTSSPE